MFLHLRKCLYCYSMIELIYFYIHFYILFSFFKMQSLMRILIFKFSLVKISRELAFRIETYRKFHLINEFGYERETATPFQSLCNSYPTAAVQKCEFRRREKKIDRRNLSH